MNELIKNAISQHSKFNQVVISIYPNRDWNDRYEIVESNFAFVIETISHYYESVCDGIHVAHANAL
jgi:hypothetical protein